MTFKMNLEFLAGSFTLENVHQGRPRAPPTVIRLWTSAAGSCLVLGLSCGETWFTFLFPELVPSFLFFHRVEITLLCFLRLGMSKVDSNLATNADSKLGCFWVPWLQEPARSWVCAPGPFHSWGCAGWNTRLSYRGTGLSLVLGHVQRLFINTGQRTWCPWILGFTIVSLTPHSSKTKHCSYFSILSPAGVSSACGVWCFLKLWRRTRSCLLSPA